MPTLKQWIEELAIGEPIEAVVIGEMGWGDYKSETVPNYLTQPRGIVLTWEAALPWISYEFEAGIGAPGCNSVMAWTASWIISVLRFDGLTEPFRVPRFPRAILPEMPGGHWLQDRPPSTALLAVMGTIIDRVDKDVTAVTSAARQYLMQNNFMDERMLSHLTEIRAQMMWVRDCIQRAEVAEARASKPKGGDQDG